MGISNLRTPGQESPPLDILVNYVAESSENGSDNGVPEDERSANKRKKIAQLMPAFEGFNQKLQTNAGEAGVSFSTEELKKIERNLTRAPGGFSKSYSVDFLKARLPNHMAACMKYLDISASDWVNMVVTCPEILSHGPVSLANKVNRLSESLKLSSAQTVELLTKAGNRAWTFSTIRILENIETGRKLFNGQHSIDKRILQRHRA
jgi:hypothetical protein